MKDLSLFYSTIYSLSFKEELTHYTFDNTSRILYGCGNTYLYGVDVNDAQITFEFDLSVAKCSDSSNSVIGIEYLTEMNSIFLANEQGDLMILSIGDQVIENVGCITDGVSAFDWSPDQELLVLISSTKNMLLMSKEFNVISEKSLENQEFGDAKFINVGWGKKETQFHGTEGKEAAKKVTVLTDKRFDWDDLEPRISWRTDAEYFLVHSINEATNVRKFQVFNREGVLHSTSENVASLESTITWKNSKTLITSSTHRANKHEIVLYERNGLSHGGFTLPFAPKEYKVTHLQWNIDSTLLCVSLEKLQTHESLVQLWYVNNYHWYLKHTTNFTKADRITSVSWDPENSLGLHLFLASGKYLNYSFGWTINSCYYPVQDYNGSVAVIDGADLLITAFKDAIIPPPLCAYKLHCQASINRVVWSTKNLDLLTYLTNGDLVYYKYQTTQEIDVKKVEIVSSRPFEADKYKIHTYAATCQALKNANVQHINWIGENELAVVEMVNSVSFLKLYSIELSENTFDLKLKKEFKLFSTVLNTSFNPTTETLALQFTNDFIYRFSNESGLHAWCMEDTPFKFPQICSYFAIASLKDSDQVGEEICIGLTDFYRLYINNKEIANNCTSFYVNEKFLIFTTHTNQLKFIDLSNKHYNANLTTGELVEESTRRLERGSKIVHCVNDDTMCVLQMPRGNLEAIHPRILIITMLKELINSLQFKRVLELMRKHRINMNILYDHNPKLFLDNVKSFVTQIDNVVLLNLFITELSNDDTTGGLYKAMYLDSANKRQRGVLDENKMNLICEKMISALESVDLKKYFLAILSCHAKKNDLDEALRKIKSMKDENSTLADEGLRHLLYLADVNQLFDIALGTYDFNIVIMVAEKSQKDPKEYLPFLNELRKLEENYRKYKIDMYLKRYKKALASIAKCDDTHHAELLKLVNEQKLYSEALNYFKQDTDIFKQISSDFATYLSNKKYYQEAGLILLRANLLTESLDAFEKSHDWKMFLSVCCKLQFTKIEFNENITRIIESLKDNHKYQEAATIYEQYLNDYESAIVSLITGSHWSDAIRLIYKYNRQDFIESNLLPSIKLTYEDLLNEIKTHRTKFNDHRERLSAVRKDKQERHMKELLENDEFIENDDASQMSSAIDGKSTTNTVKSSATSINSQFSGKSSSRNKMKKKGISLKKGSLNEDLAIIQELSDLINIVYNMQESVVYLNRTLMLYIMDDLCLNLQNEYDNLLCLIEKHLFQIWDNIENDANIQLTGDFASRFGKSEERSITDYAKLDIKYRYPPQVAIKKTSWKLHVKEST